MKNNFIKIFLIAAVLLNSDQKAHSESLIARMSAGYEWGFGYTQAFYDFDNYNYLNPNFFFNILLYQNYSNHIGSIFYSADSNKTNIMRNIQIKIPLEYINASINTNHINTPVWGVSSGFSFSNGYGYKISDTRSFDFSNGYGFGMNLLAVGNMYNKYDNFF